MAGDKNTLSFTRSGIVSHRYYILIVTRKHIGEDNLMKKRKQLSVNGGHDSEGIWYIRQAVKK